MPTLRVPALSRPCWVKEFAQIRRVFLGVGEVEAYRPIKSASVKCFSTQICCRIRPPSPLPQKNSADLRESLAYQSCEPLGVCDTALNIATMQAVVIAKLTYAASSWRSFRNSADRQHIEAS